MINHSKVDHYLPVSFLGEKKENEAIKVKNIDFRKFVSRDEHHGLFFLISDFPISFYASFTLAIFSNWVQAFLSIYSIIVEHEI